MEKGLSVPDSELLMKLVEILEVSVSQLLGSRIEAGEQPDAIAEQHARINEQLVIKNRRAKRIWKAVAIIVGCMIAAYILLIILAQLFSFSPNHSSNKNDSEDLTQNEWIYGLNSANRQYTYENEEAGGAFGITIRADGTYTYYEGFYSSYIGMGNWTLDGDILCLTEDEKTGTSFVNYFKIDGYDLIFLAENSSGLLLVDVAEGERFSQSEKAPSSKE